MSLLLRSELTAPTRPRRAPVPQVRRAAGSVGCLPTGDSYGLSYKTAECPSQAVTPCQPLRVCEELLLGRFPYLMQQPSRQEQT